MTFSESAAIAHRTATLGKGLSVEFTAAPDGRIIVEWQPATPKRLTARQLRRYHLARDEVIHALARHLGAAVAIVDMGKGHATVREVKP